VPAHETPEKALEDGPFGGPGGLTLDTTDHAGVSDDAGVANATPKPEGIITATTILNVARISSPNNGHRKRTIRPYTATSEELLRRHLSALLQTQARTTSFR
jgi:hypothetical protein